MKSRTSASLLLLACCCSLGADPLPLPTRGVPDEPPLPASVVTAGGQRLLLSDTNVAVTYDVEKRCPVVNRPGVWATNYPLGKVGGLEGRSEDESARLLFGVPRSQLRNWYFKTPGSPLPEPSRPSAPAPVELSPAPTMVVDGDAPTASDDNAGTAEKPLKTISAALAKAKPGDVVRVRPGIYRETLCFTTAGTADRPVRVEGERSDDGQMPVVSGNDVFPPQSWKPADGLKGVFRAAIFTDQPGVVSVDGKALKEASWPDQLQRGEFCFNRASIEFLRNRPGDAAAPNSGLAEGGKSWRRIEADKDGFLQFGAGSANAVLFMSSWVWVPPREREGDVVWDPRFPEPITGRLQCKGPFRAFRQTGSHLGTQVNKYRLWVNGELLPSVWVPGKPRAHHNYGKEDRWENFVLNEGWNHLLFQFDTTTKPASELKFRFGVPKGIASYVCSAETPTDRSKPGNGESADHLSEALLLGPFSAAPDCGVYVRLPGDRDPNTVAMDLSKHTLLADLSVPFTQVAGLEFRHGASFQQRALLNVSAEGCLVEGCVFRDCEVRGITVALGEMDQTDAPIVVRNNWVINPGSLGIGASGDSKKLTPQNQDGLAPGRGRMVCEYNRIVNNNCNGYPRFWESGGFKMFRLTSCVLRNNTFVGGDGPAIWLDWEHYGNRIEGNVLIDGTGFCVGVEASPGPNLVANNLCVNLKSGGVWFRHAVLAWSSHAVWALHNTVDGRWNDTPAWQGKTGGGGIYLHEGGADRHTRWGAVPKQQAILNNLVAGVDVGDVFRRWGWNPNTPEEGNFHDTRAARWNGEDEPLTFLAPEALDYRLRAGAAAEFAGTRHDLQRLVRHDFYGLLRHDDLPPVAGAFRVDPPAPPDAKVLIELELADGTMKRLY